MSSRKILWSLLLTAIVFLMVMVGCSSKKFTNSSTTISDNADPTTYIPLNQGWRVSYTRTEPTTEHYDIEVADPVTIDGNQGYTIRRTVRSGSSFEQTISYMYANSIAVYETSSTNDPGAIILKAPFTVGSSWDRSKTVIISDTTISGEDGGGLHRADGNELAYNTMQIVAKESVLALDGLTYSNCLKVEWQIGEHSYIYYWYAANIGLVKFQVVPNALSASENNTISVMSDFAQIQY
ncbi:MAG: hypothetical protein KAR42_09610 [candidate division Zixibacteria bacterium]|nr:hypothetical protein [candidate division Zixibacteria bacterium]